LKIKIIPQDVDDMSEIFKIREKIDNLDAEYVNEISDEIFKYQPFFVTVLVGYHIDVSPEELEEIMKIYFLIWEYFKQNKNVKTKKVTEAFFENILNRNIQMLKYVDGETEQHEIQKIYVNDLQRLKSKALFAEIFHRFNSRPVLLKMEKPLNAIILLGIKSFIECFETI